MNIANRALAHVVGNTFGFNELKPEQEEIIRESIAGRDILAVLPTGFGKSPCFQIPAIVTNSRTLVVSPLIALQEDQVNKLRKNGLKAFALHSGLDDARKAAVHYYFKSAPKNEPSFLYLSPELLLTGLFHQHFDNVGFNRLVVDEAHCVSTWGNSFRPDYQRIRLATMRMQIKNCSAFTATTDKKIERDIRKRIPLRPDFLRIAVDPTRSNLKINIDRMPHFGSHLRALRHRMIRLISLFREPAYQGAAIVYCTTRSSAATLYGHMSSSPWLDQMGYSISLFHAALPFEDKVESLKAFMTRPRPIVVATSAFGMGIDRADVRQVIHYRTPYSLVDYAQQFGRAGRDGEPALCTTFHEKEWYLENEIQRVKFDLPTFDTVERTLHRLRDRVQKLSSADRKAYDLHKYMRSFIKAIQASDEIINKSSVINRMQSSVALLQKAGLIHENADGLSVHDVMPGSQNHARLIELTQMHERMLLREKERVNEFFGATQPDQRLLWELIDRAE